MNLLMTAKKFTSVKLGRSGLLLKKVSPEIFITVGVVGLTYSVWKIAKADVKARKILNYHHEEFDSIEKAKEFSERSLEVEYTDKEYKKDKMIVTLNTGTDLVKLYGPPVLLAASSIACIFGSHIIMKKRNAALITAFSLLDETFKNYRGRVVEEYGKEVDNRFRNGIYKEKITVEETDENGKKKKIKKEIDVYDPNKVSIYAREFGEGKTKEWTNNADYNLAFIKGQQNYVNDLLRIRGHVFLNDVYDALGFERSKEGAIVGWALGNGDDYIDFSLQNVNVPEFRNEYACDTIGEERSEFITGYRTNVLLDFNVDGIVYDLI